MWLGHAGEQRILGERSKSVADLPRTRSFGARRHGTSRRRIFLPYGGDRARLSVHRLPGNAALTDRITYTLAVMNDAAAPYAARELRGRSSSRAAGRTILERAGLTICNVRRPKSNAGLVKCLERHGGQGAISRRASRRRKLQASRRSLSRLGEGRRRLAVSARIAGRYHLYVSLACPWACRTVIVRKLKGLEDAIGMTVVDPIRDERGWRFTSSEPDPHQRLGLLERSLFCHRSRISRARDRAGALGQRAQAHRQQLRRRHHAHVRKRVRRVRHQSTARSLPARAARGDRRAQRSPIRNVQQRRLSRRVCDRAGALRTRRLSASSRRSTRWKRGSHDQRYLFGAQPLETDWRFFVTLVRFDPVYYGHFKCNLRRIVDYPNLYGYLARSLPDRRRRRNGELRPHQAALLHDARRHQSDPDRPDRPADRPDRAARPGAPLASLHQQRPKKALRAALTIEHMFD